MSAEASLWASVRRALSHYGRLVRVESGAVGVGTPDVYYQLAGESGWIELKSVGAIARPSTAVRIPHLKSEQVTWLAEEERAGGRAFLLLRVGRVGGLLRPAAAAKIYRGEVTLRELGGVCEVGWVGPVPGEPLARRLRRPPRS